MPEFNITEWDPTSMAPDATILIVGKRHTGKTTLTRDLMLHMKNRLELVVGMNPTEMGNHNLEFFTPKSFIFHSFDDQKLHHILDWQKRSVANNKARRIGFIMDDCMSETSGGAGGKKKKVMSSGDISKIFKIGRHFKIFYICTMQYICDAPPEIRGNVDLLFVFNTTSGLEREKLWKDYFAQFQKYKDFCKVFDACAVGYDCMVLDTRKAASNANCIFYYRAKMIEEPFQVGRSIYWKLSEYYFTDKTDYDMDASKVLGVLPRNLEPVQLENDDHLVIRRN
jgi:hypothetical protein